MKRIYVTFSIIVSLLVLTSLFSTKQFADPPVTYPCNIFGYFTPVLAADGSNMSVTAGFNCSNVAQTNAIFSCSIAETGTQIIALDYASTTGNAFADNTFAIPSPNDFKNNNNLLHIACSLTSNGNVTGQVTYLQGAISCSSTDCQPTSNGGGGNNWNEWCGNTCVNIFHANATGGTNQCYPAAYNDQSFNSCPSGPQTSPAITDCLTLDHGLAQCAYGSCPAPLSPLSQGSQSCQQIYGKGRQNASSGTCCGPTTGNQCGKCGAAGSYCSGTPGYCENSIQCSNGQPVVQVYKCDTTHHAWLPPYNQPGNSTCFTNPCNSPGGFNGSDYQCPNKLPSGDTCCYSVAKNTCFAGTGGTGFNPPTCNYHQPNTSPILCPGQSGSSNTLVISGSIWLDSNGDGQWNNNEKSSNFTASPQITLHEPGGQTVQTTPTGGGYSFHNLASGTYSITVAGFTPTNASSLQNIQLSQSMNRVNIGDNSNISPSPNPSPATTNVYYSGCAGLDSAHSTCLYSPKGDSCSTATSGKYVNAPNYIPTQAHVTNDACGNNAPGNVPSGKTVLCCVPPNISPSPATSPSPNTSPRPSPSSGASQGPLGPQACGPGGVGKCFKNACGGQYPDASFAQPGTGVCNTNFGSSAICCGPTGSVGPLNNSSGVTKCGPSNAGFCYWNSCSGSHPTIYGGAPAVCASTYGAKAICCH